MELEEIIRQVNQVQGTVKNAGKEAAVDDIPFLLRALQQFIDRVPLQERFSPLNPNIEKVVQSLQDAGFSTTDSGDGATHDHECDRPYPYVAMTCDPTFLAEDAHDLKEWCEEQGIDVGSVGDDVWIQASYDPGNKSAILELVGVTDDDLRPET